MGMLSPWLALGAGLGCPPPPPPGVPPPTWGGEGGAPLPPLGAVDADGMGAGEALTDESGVRLTAGGGGIDDPVAVAELLGATRAAVPAARSPWVIMLTVIPAPTSATTPAPAAIHGQTGRCMG